MMINGHILIVDDDTFICQTLVYQLQERGYGCHAVHDAESAIAAVTDEAPPALVILDYFLGAGAPNGLELCRTIRALAKTPVVMLTANENTRTIVSCLDAGAAQYMVKPYDIEELTARIRVTIRENSGPDWAGAHSTQSILHTDVRPPYLVNRVLTAGNRQVELTEKEDAVLGLMLSKPGHIIHRNTLHQVVYGRDLDQPSRAMDVLIGRTRKKLESLDCNMTICSVRGEGYLLQPIKSALPASEALRHCSNA